MSLQRKGLGRGELPCRIQRGDRRRQGGWRRKRGTERERNDNPFGGHNAEPGTVKLTRQEIRPTNRPLSLHLPLFLRLFPWPLSRPPLCSFTPQRTYLWLYANRHRSLRASHKLTELYYADPLPLCPPLLSSPLCSRDALHSSTFSLFFTSFFSYKSRSKSQQGERRPLETDGMLIRRDSAVNTIHSLFQTAVRIKIETVHAL